MFATFERDRYLRYQTGGRTDRGQRNAYSSEDEPFYCRYGRWELAKQRADFQTEEHAQKRIEYKKRLARNQKIACRFLLSSFVAKFGEAPSRRAKLYYLSIVGEFNSKEK